MRRVFTFMMALGTGGCMGNFNPDLGGSIGTTDNPTGSTDDPTGSTDAGNSMGTTGAGGTTDDPTGTTNAGIPDGCGDGEAQGDEECDGLDLRGSECTAFNAPANGNYSGGSLSCNDDCTLQFGSCSYCGDNVENHPSEECDGIDLGPDNCVDEGFDGGDLSCDAQCNLVTASCENCEGDVMGMYGSMEEAECGGQGHGNNTNYYSVCLPNVGCAMDSDCADPNLAICANQPVCTDVGGGAPLCKILCEADEECPGGMVCHNMFANGMFCMWET